MTDDEQAPETSEDGTGGRELWIENVPLGEWRAVARTRRVLKSWMELERRAPENLRVCLAVLRTKPTERIAGRVFPLKHRQYQGAWEYEVTSGDRVFYVPDATTKIVDVYYAGKHVRPAPVP